MKKKTISFISGLVGCIIGVSVTKNIKKNPLKKVNDMSEKHLSLFLMMNQWIKVYQEGKHISMYFEKNNYKKIAIYGMSYVGETLLNELKSSKIQVLYGIDKNANSICSDIDVFTLEDELEEVDAIVVTAITFFDEIEEQISKKFDVPIISLEDILYEM